MAKNTLPEADNTWKESEGTGEIMTPVEALTEPAALVGTSAVKMCRGDVIADVAPQDVAGFKSAGYEVIN